MSQKPDLSSSSYSSSEEEVSGSEDEQTSGSDSGQKPKPEPKQTLTVPPPKSATKSQPPDLSESESGSDSGSDSDSPPKKTAVVDVNVKPLNSIPMESKPVKKDGSKPISTSTSSPAKPPAKIKRPLHFPAPATKKDPKKAKPNTTNGEVKKPSYPDLSESEDFGSISGSETDKDSDSPPKKSVLTQSNVKPTLSKQIESKSAKKTGSKPVATSSPAKSKLPAMKSPPMTMTSPVTAKKGEKSSVTAEERKKQLFQRLWSDDDEIAILEGMIEYKDGTGESPIADMGAFHEFIKRSLHVDVSKAQLGDKIRRMKKKYVNNASREKEGRDINFSKSHEQKGYDLSKLIWGSNGNGNSNSNSQTEGKKKKKNQSKKNAVASLLKLNGVGDKDVAMMEVEKKVDVSRFVRYGEMSDSPIVSEEILKAGLELVEGSKRAELEGKWRKLKELELELYVKRMELLREQALVVLEAVRSSGN